MLTKRLIPLIFTGAMAIGTGYAADIIVKERPPRLSSKAVAGLPAKATCGFPAITAGTEITIPGKKAAGIDRHTRMRAG